MTEQERRELIAQMDEWLEEATARRERSRLESARVLAMIDLARDALARAR